MSARDGKAHPRRLKTAKAGGAGWKWKRPAPNGDIPPLPVGKFTDIEGQLMIPLAGEPELGEEASDV